MGIITPTIYAVPLMPFDKPTSTHQFDIGRARRSFWVLFAFVSILFVAPVFFATFANAIGVCTGGNRAAHKVTCIYDGDTGWQEGQKWRMLNIDAPEIDDGAACRRENQIGHAARDRLIQLMNQGYEIHYYGQMDKSGRLLVDIFANGKNVAKTLKSEGLAQKWPNRGNVWCN